MVTSRDFDAVTGWLYSIQSGLGGGNGLQYQSYLYDLVGNIRQRQEGSVPLIEDFYYDNLYRRDYTELNGVQNLDVTYDAAGNITNRSDVNGNASWTYHVTKKHAVASTGSGGVTFSYDANGNMTNRAGSTISWTSYNFPFVLATSTETTTFYYGPDRQYFRQEYTGPSGSESTYYIGGILEKVTAGGVVDWRHYVKVEGQTVAVISRKSNSTNAVHYPLEDNQGSSSTLTDGSGSLLVRQSYTAFGLPRDGADWDGAVPSGDKATINGISRRGFTGHSMLGDMGLIHMNGRVYDATIGRFLSPDPTIPNPGFTQSFNRYAYVNNNPATYTDPSGFAEQASSGDGEDLEELDDVLVTATRVRRRVSGCAARPEGCGRDILIFVFPDHYGHPCRNGLWSIECDVRTEEVSVMDEETRQERLKRLNWPRMSGQGPKPPPPPPEGFGIKDAASLVVGITPAGIYADLCTAATGRDCITGEKVSTFSRFAGIVPGFSELRKIGKALEIGQDAARAAPSLSAHKKALSQVHEEVGRQPKGEPGKFGSPQAGDTKKGYRLDPAHPNAAPGSPEAGPHINWWDWTNGKKGRGGRSGAVPIED